MNISKILKVKILKPIFFYWIKKDFNRNMDLLEEFSLRKHMQSSLSEESINEEHIPNMIDCISSFIISMYNNPEEIPECNGSFEEEANFIIDSFIDAYKSGVINKNNDLLSYLGIPEINLSNEEIEYFNEKKNNFVDENEVIENINSNEFKEKIDYIFNLIDKYYKQNYKTFWRPGVKHYAVAVWYILYKCADDIENFSEEYGIEYIDDGEQRCLFNYFNLYIHSIVFTGEILLDLKTRKSLFAAAAIHPAQDDYIDKNDVNKDIIDIIDKSIKGEKVHTDNDEVMPVLRLIELIYENHPTDENPILVHILLELNKWQLYSMEQKKRKNIDEDELLKISFMKGGYAFAFYGYIALGKMDILQFRHFFGMGAIFQIMDDLHDIEIDLDNGVETIWTKKINKSENIDLEMYGVVATQMKFEEITNAIESLKRPVFLRRMELFAVRLDLCKFYLLNKKYFSDDLLDKVNVKYNIDLNSYLDEFKIQLDELSSIKDFKDRLFDIKDSYTKIFLKGK